MSRHRLEFRESENPWAPTAVLEEVNGRTKSGLEIVGLAAQTGGRSSAAYVRWPDGRGGVLTRTKVSLERMRQTGSVLAAVRDKGVPVPRHELIVGLADGYVAVVQERLPGKPPSGVDARVIEAMVATNDRFAGLLVDRPDVPAPSAFPSAGQGTHPWERTLGRYSDRSRRLLARIIEVAGGEPYRMVGHDLVHTDYILGNVLHDEAGQVTGVIDWNAGAARGDRRFALIALLVDLDGYRLATSGGPHRVQPDARERLDELVRQRIDPGLLRLYWAHWRAHKVHRLIRNNRPTKEIDHALNLAETGIAG